MMNFLSLKVGTLRGEGQDDLMDSHYWILIDGIMNQSRIWLLELFEWELFQTETKLSLSR